MALTSPKHALIYHQAGADRSGPASALWKVTEDGLPKSLAKNQLSIFVGHFASGPTGALDYFFEKWKPKSSFGKKA